MHFSELACQNPFQDSSVSRQVFLERFRGWDSDSALKVSLQHVRAVGFTIKTAKAEMCGIKGISV
jgi:hypothetical protein